MSFHGIPVPYEGRIDWLTKRGEGIGASDVAGILELSPYSSPYSVWADKVMGSVLEETEAMHFGKRLETVIEAEFEERTGLWIGGRELLLRHPEHEWAMATVDGLAFESPMNDAVIDWLPQPAMELAYASTALANVEFKTSGEYGRWDAVPDHYQIQCQWQMFVEGLDTTMLACLHGGRRFELYDVAADELVQEKMLEKVSLFRDKFLLEPDENNHPEVDAHPATTRAISDLFSETSDDVIELSQGNYADVKAYAFVKGQIRDLEDEAEKLKNRIAVSLQDATAATWKGKPVLTFKSITVKEHVRRESTFRRLVLAKEEK